MVNLLCRQVKVEAPNWWLTESLLEGTKHKLDCFDFNPLQVQWQFPKIGMNWKEWVGFPNDGWLICWNLQHGHRPWDDEGWGTHKTLQIPMTWKLGAKASSHHLFVYLVGYTYLRIGTCLYDFVCRYTLYVHIRIYKYVAEPRAVAVGEW